MKRKIAVLIVLLLAFAFLIGPFAVRMKNRPLIEKIGYLPDSVVMRIVSADQKPLAAAGLVFKTMMYYGGLSEGDQKKSFSSDLTGMEKTLTTATRLDPYNMDAYYFGQATLVWDLQHFAEANALLDYGMHHRDWDFYLPLFAGFNSAYFMKDYESAARYYRRVGELTGSDYFMKLTGRYLYDIGETEQAISYLTTMVEGARNDAVRLGLSMRLEAFQAVRKIEVARDRFRDATGKLPEDLNVLLKGGYLAALPIDPYGGTFFIDNTGKIHSTSKFIPDIAEKGRE